MDGKFDKERRDGCLVDIRPDDLDQTNFQMLSSSVKLKTNHFFIPAVQPMDLLFLRVIFSHLRKQTKAQNNPSTDDDALNEESLPFEAFQRAFERMFFVLRDPLGFDARSYDDNGDGYVTWCEFFHVYTKRNMTIYVSIPERIFLTIDNPDTCKLASWVSATMLSTIIISSLCFILGTVPECQVEPIPSQCGIWKTIEDVCLMLFVIEYCLRLFTCWAVRSEIFDKTELHNMVVGFEPIKLPSPVTRLWRFIFAPSNLIDLAAILPGVIGQFVKTDGGAFVVLRLIRLTRIFRALKSPAFVAPVQVIARTVQQSTKALYVLMFNLCLGIVIFGSLMYMAEGGSELNAFGFGGKWNDSIMKYERVVGRNWDLENARWVEVWEESPFQSIPHAFWWAITTVTTVGYGDHHPTTSLGYFVAVSTMVFSLVILALPIGIIGNNFKQEWDDFEERRQRDAETLEDEMRFITSAIKTLDPFRMSKLMLIEVWHDNPNLHPELTARSPPASFMGEAKLSLSLPKDKPMTVTTTVRLEENVDLIKRSVTGTITVRIEWEPDDSSINEEEESMKCTGGARVVRSQPVESPRTTEELRGSLKVTLLQADKLVNLNCSRPEDGPCPYALILCYPAFQPKDRTPVPCAWRSPVYRNSISPKWNTSHVFDFKWSRHTLNMRNAQDDFQSVSRRGRFATASLGDSARPGSAGGDHVPIVKLDEALGLLHEFALELRQQRADIKQVRDDIRNLSTRVDRLSEASAMAISGEASGSTLLPNCVPNTE
mmetsp:Transcript_7975/g.20604  ORF Transcript_7975/g.20604 Transcript_7975/m.20604 type:complete len:771 (-) Transcript_7975:87-2399(-)